MLHIVSPQLFSHVSNSIVMKICHTRWTSWSSLRSPNWLSSQQTGLGTCFTWLALHWITQAMNKVEKMLMEVERRVEMMQVARKARRARPVLCRKQELRMKNCIFVCIYILPPKHRRIHTYVHWYFRTWECSQDTGGVRLSSARMCESIFFGENLVNWALFHSTGQPSNKVHPAKFKRDQLWHTWWPDKSSNTTEPCNTAQYHLVK